jgi:hypothetical protein
MRNFKQILNKISIQKTQAFDVEPCCEAAEKFDVRDFVEFTKSVQNLPLTEKALKGRDYLIWKMTEIINLYCQCINSPITKPSQIGCLREIDNFIKNGSFDKNPNLSAADRKLEPGYRTILYKTFLIFKRLALDITSRNYNYDLSNNNSIDFLNDFCNWRRIAAPSLLRDVRGAMFDEPFEQSLQQELEELFQRIPMVGGVEEAQIADCEVSAENDSVKGWATALAVSAATAAAAIALYRLTRGRSAKTCTPDGKTKGVRILSRILCGAAAGGATQNAPSQETCDAVAEQIINDECSPNPSLCEPPSGGGGGGSQPPGGEVEPPSGGGGGVMGGDGML